MVKKGEIDDTISLIFIEDQVRVLKNQIKAFNRYKEIKVVDTATTGKEGVKKVVEKRPDVALVDLGLPDISGIEVSRLIKESAPGVEILIYTVFNEEEKVLDALMAGASGYVLKGIETEKLVYAIKDIHNGGMVIQPRLARTILNVFKKEFKKREKSESDEDINLTPREKEILTLLAKGLPNSELAEVLGLSIHTIKSHLENIYRKLNVTNRTEAVTFVLSRGLID